jgi:predicted glycogen debranching enzyme
MSGPIATDERTEWLEADGLGGFASGTTSGIRTRRYHALLLAATSPPTGRMVLVNGLDAWIERPGEPVEYLTRQRYAPGIVAPEHGAVLEGFADEPWPSWSWRLRDGSIVEQELFVPHGMPVVAIRWRRTGGDGRGSLVVRPFFSGRDTHALHHANPDFRFETRREEESLTWEPYPGVPAVSALADGDYVPDPQWYRGFQYDEERARGLDFEEDLASPGCFHWGAEQGDAVLLLGVSGSLPRESRAAPAYRRLRRSERARRGRFGSRLERAGDAYLVRRGAGRTIVAGYPWFTDWGRDTFIALR